MATTNYTGRSVDLFIFQGAKATGEQQVTLAFGNAGQVTTGIQKLLQTFAIMFLTQRESKQYDPEFGTDFVLALQQGRIRDEGNVRTEFALASELVRQRFAAESLINPVAADETFESALLNSFVLDKGKSLLTLSVSITSAAGTVHEIFLPVSFAIK